MRLAVRIIHRIFYGNIKRMVRFSIVGVSNTLIDFLAFTILYSVIRLDYIPSQISGYSIGMLNSFIFNRKWTFGDSKSNKKTAHAFLQFAVINLISLAASVLAMNFLVEYGNINVFLSKIAVILIAQLTNFLSYKLWVFAPRKSIIT